MAISDFRWQKKSDSGETTKPAGERYPGAGQAPVKDVEKRPLVVAGVLRRA